MPGESMATPDREDRHRTGPVSHVEEHSTGTGTDHVAFRIPRPKTAGKIAGTGSLRSSVRAPGKPGHEAWTVLECLSPESPRRGPALKVPVPGAVPGRFECVSPLFFRCSWRILGEIDYFFADLMMKWTHTENNFRQTVENRRAGSSLKGQAHKAPVRTHHRYKTIRM